MADLSETVTLRAGGRIVIPAAMRTALGLRPGDVLVARVEGGELRLIPRAAEIARVQALLRPYRRPGTDEVDAFIADRRSLWGED